MNSRFSTGDALPVLSSNADKLEPVSPVSPVDALSVLSSNADQLKPVSPVSPVDATAGHEPLAEIEWTEVCHPSIPSGFRVFVPQGEEAVGRGRIKNIYPLYGTPDAVGIELSSPSTQALGLMKLFGRTGGVAIERSLQGPVRVLYNGVCRFSVKGKRFEIGTRSTFIAIDEGPIVIN